jgi:hypothetical protein
MRLVEDMAHGPARIVLNLDRPVMSADFLLAGTAGRSR